MFRSFLLSTAAVVAIAMPTMAAADTIETVTVTAARLAEARNGIQPDLGASTYTITSANIDAQPGGENNGLNQVVLQAPGVAQDSFGQLHVRGEHNGLQYRIDGIIIPEGISVFGQTLNPRFVQSMRLITGALPAEYGDRTAGIIDVQTKTGLFAPGGQVGVYGGSHSEITPSIDYGGSVGGLNYFVSGDYTTNTLGIESPDGSVDPLHDRTKQWHGFAFLQDIIDQNSSITGIFGTSNDMFQIPNVHGLQPSGLDGITGLGPVDPGTGNNVLLANGQFAFPSEALNQNQREITHYGIVSYLRTMGSFDFSVSGFGRYSSLFYTPDQLGELLYNGIAQTAYKKDVAYGVQAEGAFHLGDSNTIRAGVIYQADDIASRTTSSVFAVDGAGNQLSDVPLVIPDNSTKHAWSYSIYLQDEWKIFQSFVLNFGVRYDQFQAFDAESQVSPRVNFVWTPTDTTTIHGGFSRYFSPPPIELIASADIALFANTTAAPANTVNDTPKAERADYYDIGINQTIFDGMTVGVDSFYKASHNLIDEGQFGAPIILTPFNYLSGRQYGVEFTAAYETDNFSSYVNAAYERAVGRDIVSSQFQFDPGNLAYIATHYIPLDHQQLGSVSAGASYKWRMTRFSVDLLYGTGLRADGATPNGGHVPAYTQVNLGVSHDFDFGSVGTITTRFDVVNVLDEKYLIRDGSGVGVGAPQFGPRRGFFVGISKSL